MLSETFFSANEYYAPDDLAYSGLYGGERQYELHSHDLIGGRVDVLLATGGVLVGSSEDAAEHWLNQNGNRKKYFNIARVDHKHPLFDGIIDSYMSDRTWLDNREQIDNLNPGGLVELMSSPELDEVSLFELEQLTRNQSVIAKLFKKSGVLEDSQRDLYINTFDAHATQLRNYFLKLFPEFVGKSCLVPFRGAALVARPFIDHSKILPVKFTRIPTGNVDHKSFSVGISASREEFREPIISDLSEAANDNYAVVLEACITTGITNISDMAFRKSIGVLPDNLLIISPAASRQGIVNIFEAARSFGVSVKILTSAIYPRIGNAWGTGEDSIQNSEGESVLGDPPSIAGEDRMIIRIRMCEDLFSRRHNDPYLG